MMRSAPNFTRAMRGYDVEEVDEYVQALRESEDEHARALAAAESTNAVLNGEIDRLHSRVNELESCVRSETPRSIAALGERLTLVLEEAEAAAADAVRVAKEEAQVLLSAARTSAEEERVLSAARGADAEQRAKARIAGAEESAWATEMAARKHADDLVEEAEQRALARRQEIEAWVEQVRAHIEGEELRAAEEFARIRAVRGAELMAMERRRDALFTSLSEMADGLRATVAGARNTTDAATELSASPPIPPALATGPAAPADAAVDVAGTPSDAAGAPEHGGTTATDTATPATAGPDPAIDDPAIDDPANEHPANEHPAGEHPAGEPPAGSDTKSGDTTTGDSTTGDTTTGDRAEGDEATGEIVLEDGDRPAAGHTVEVDLTGAPADETHDLSRPAPHRSAETTALFDGEADPAPQAPAAAFYGGSWKR